MLSVRSAKRGLVLRISEAKGKVKKANKAEHNNKNNYVL